MLTEKDERMKTVNMIRSMKKVLQTLVISSVLLGGCANDVKTIDLSSVETANVEGLYIVDCLLPSSVRQLGTRLTYLGARRVIKTSGTTCGIRGGGYVAYDRANYQTALKIWLPLAQGGDPKAQAYVGEIYEKGLGTQPNYASAAKWYQQAANQGYARAKMSLGSLYERGLGVSRNNVQALKLYRDASGLADRQVEFVTASQRQARVDQGVQLTQLTNEAKAAKQREGQLLAEVNQLQAEATKLRNAPAKIVVKTERVIVQDRRQIDQLNREVANLRRHNKQIQQKMSQAPTTNPNDARMIESQKVQIAQKQARIVAIQTELKQALTRPRAPDPAKERLIKQLNSEVANLRNHNKQIQQKMSQAPSTNPNDARMIQNQKAQIAQKQARIVAIQSELKNALSRPQTSVNPAKERLIRQLNSEVASLRKQNANILRNASKAPANATQARQIKVQKAQIAQKQAKIVAVQKELQKEKSSRATSDNGARLRKVAVIEREIKVKKAELTKQQKKVTAIALRSPKEVQKKNSLRGVNFGNYYAVVIGNNNYSSISSLKTPVNDAKAIASVLKSQYGFKTIVLQNATRGKMLATLDSLRKRLTNKDNLVIYYAGHGELKGGRGFWLPTDAKSNDQKSWISNEQMTNFIDAMNAKHVLVIADSCYSGTLSQSSIPRPVLNSGKDRAWFDAVVKTKVRVVMSSGGVKPVLDSGSGGHSVFAGALLSALRSGSAVVEGAGLYRSIRQEVKASSSARGNKQTPRYAPIRFAGHEAGDFIFVQGRKLAQVNTLPGKDDETDTDIRLFTLREFLLVLKA